MGRKALATVGGLVALYLVVAYATGFAKAFSSTATGGANVIKALQGR